MTRRKMRRVPEWILKRRAEKIAAEKQSYADDKKDRQEEIKQEPTLAVEVVDPKISTRLHREEVARWTLARQRLVLQLHRAGFDHAQIADRLQSIGKTSQKVHQQQIASLIQRGIPFPREAPAHRCKKCSKVIVTDFCLTCEIKEMRNEQRTLEAV